MASPGPRSGSVRAKLVVNTLLAVSFVAISAPQATRMPVHEWLSIAFIGILAVHLIFSWTWIVNVTRRFFSSLRGPVRFNYVWDSSLYLMMVAVMVSGIVISEAALPALGIRPPPDRFWSVVHDLTSEALLIMVGVHLAMHWDWVSAAVRRLLAGSLAAGSAGSGTMNGWLRPAAMLTTVAAVLSLATLALGATPIAERMRARSPRAQQRQAAAASETAAPALAPPSVSGAAQDQGQTPPVATELPAERPRRRQGAAKKGAARQGAAKGRAPGLSVRQRYIQPAIKIVSFMGIPFVLTLGVLALIDRGRSAVTRRQHDPLDESHE